MPAGDMDQQYSIGITNRFMGISHDIVDSDPHEIIRAAQEKPKKEKDVKTKGNKNVKNLSRGKDKVKADPAPQSPVETNNNNTRDGDRPRGRGRGRGRGGDRGRGRGRGGSNYNNDGGENQESRGPRGACHRCGEEGHFIRNCPQPRSPPAQTGNSDFGAPSNGGFGAPGGGFGSGESGFGAPTGGGFGGGFGNDDEDKRGGRGGFRGGRGGRGRGRGGRGGAREFDRRSGNDKSSVKAFDKKDGSGSYNWGTPQDELDASEEQPQGFGTPKEDEPSNESGEQQEGVTSGEETENKEEQEPEQISFAEWKKRESENRTKTQHNIRKANEGEKLKGLKQLRKPTEEENESDGSLFFPTKYIEETVKTSGRVKKHLNVDFQYGNGDNRHMDTSRRGGRGRGRGGRGGRGGRSDNTGGGSKQIQLENAEEFPSL